MADSGIVLQEIFDREIDRLNKESKERPLSELEVKILANLVTAYSKFKKQYFQPDDEYDNLSEEDLLNAANPTSES